MDETIKEIVTTTQRNENSLYEMCNNKFCFACTSLRIMRKRRRSVNIHLETFEKMNRVASAYHHINYILKHRPLCFPVSIHWRFNRWKIFSYLTATFDVFMQLFILGPNPDTDFPVNVLILENDYSYKQGRTFERSIHNFVASLNLTVFGCGVIPGGQTSTRTFTASGPSNLPIIAVYTESNVVSALVPGIATSRGAVQALAQRFAMQTVVDVLEIEGRRALLL
ncbi:hypothetical protein KIN20_010184 [Parelaphostrongylus tenuis]|uniref:Uncharacterized protein n=1 Tax=Parelaphostrongylus tenuis TaxID=148309 RepID=A0AAD5M987_PARTN|nr:hypothetical protein KIN20_010184 [Parelaphostrongylus tenuis]